MKVVQISDRVETEKEALRWSLSWLPDGHCDSFTREAILACAPPTSGVYGLFNFDCQVFIGESANIQKALLRHQSETNFQSRHLQPTGFTFEPCAAELRKVKADQLIAKFHPVLQTEAGLNEIRSPSNDPRLNEVAIGGQEFENDADCQEFPVHDYEKRAPVQPLFYFMRMRGAAFAAMFVASAVVIFSLGMPFNYAIQNPANGANPTSGPIEIGPRTQNGGPIEAAEKPANQTEASIPAKLDVPRSASIPNGAGIQAVVKPANVSPIVESVESGGLSKKWSVQISAAPAKDIADNLVQRLIANGYNGYVVQAEVKGQTYYRVRVGRFDKREEAESMRQSLAHQEGYHDAYLIGD